MKITSQERRRILAGDTAALKRQEQPDCNEGERIVLLRRKAKTVITDREQGHVHTYPAQDLVWIELEDPLRHRLGHWLVKFELHDLRDENVRLLRPGGPAGPPGRPGLHTRVETSPEKPRRKGEGVRMFTAESERGYGGVGHQALDAESVTDDVLAKQRIEADLRAAEYALAMDSDHEARRQERAVRQQLREAVRDLEPGERQRFLGRVQMAIQRAREDLPRDVA